MTGRTGVTAGTSTGSGARQLAWQTVPPDWPPDWPPVTGGPIGAEDGRRGVDQGGQRSIGLGRDVTEDVEVGERAGQLVEPPDTVQGGGRDAVERRDQAVRARILRPGHRELVDHTPGLTVEDRDREYVCPQRTEDPGQPTQ
jgi:hypothetical protein